MSRIDCHVLAWRAATHPQWLTQCLDALASEPCRVTIYPSTDLSIGAARAEALGRATAPYVTWVDDDDWVRPGVMGQCLDYLERHPGCVGVYTDLDLLSADGRMTRRYLKDWSPLWQLTAGPWGITHLKVMRRTAVLPYLNEMPQWPTYEEYVLCGLVVAHGYWHHIPMSGAVKRVLPRSERSERLARPGLLEAAARRVAPTLLAAHRRGAGDTTATAAP